MFRAVFRVDSSTVIGSGHLMRCLTLAHELKKKDFFCSFICREFSGNYIEVVTKAGFEVWRLSDSLGSSSEASAQWLGVDWGVDVAHTKEAIKEDMVDWMIVDHYGIDHRWESAMRSRCKRLMVIDDLADRKHDCDLLLDQNLVNGCKIRYQQLCSINCGMLLGPKYALLQSQFEAFHERRKIRSGPIREILVYLGGGDVDRLTETVVKGVLALNRSGIKIHVVVGGGSKQKKKLIEKMNSFESVTCYSQLESLAGLMDSADLAIGAAGSSSWERCCLGLPSLVVVIAENQKPIAEELNRLGVVRFIGGRDVNESVISDAVSLALDLSSNELSQWSERVRGLVDGKGTKRIAEIISINPMTEIMISDATTDDCDVLFDWVNDPLVRVNSFNVEHIDYETHKNWFHSKMGCKDKCRIFLFRTKDGLPVGQARFELVDGSWHIDYSIASFARGRGIATNLVSLALAHLVQSEGKCKIIADVKISNKSSCRVFQKLSFEAKSQTKDAEDSVFVRFERVLC